MEYLLDANVLITASERYYELHRVPQFWAWLASRAEDGNIKMPSEVIEEIKPTGRNGELMRWLRDNRASLALSETDLELELDQVLAGGYGIERTDHENLRRMNASRDPVLVAYALTRAHDRCVVTLEIDRSTPQSPPLPANRKIPFVCRRLGIRCINTFDLIRELDFRIPLASAPA